MDARQRRSVDFWFMRALVAVVLLLVSCSSESKPASACSADGDCARSDLSTLCVRHVCRAGACATEPLVDNTPVPTAFLAMPCSKLVCIKGEVTAVADPTYIPTNLECTAYECEGTELITRELVGKPCPGGVCGTMNRCEPPDAGADSGSD